MTGRRRFRSDGLVLRACSRRSADRVARTVAGASPAETTAILERQGLRRRLSNMWANLRVSAVSRFAYVETAGFASALGLVRGALRRPAPAVPARLSLLTARQPEGATLRDDKRVCLARYRDEHDLLTWSLDDDCLLEQAQALLPVAGADTLQRVYAGFDSLVTLEPSRWTRWSVEGARLARQTSGVA